MSKLTALNGMALHGKASCRSDIVHQKQTMIYSRRNASNEFHIKILTLFTSDSREVLAPLFGNGIHSEQRVSNVQFD